MRNNSVFSLPILFIFSAGLQLSFLHESCMAISEIKRKENVFSLQNIIKLSFMAGSF